MNVNSEKLKENKDYGEEFENFRNKIEAAMERHFGDDYIVQIKEVTKTNGLTIHGLTILKKSEHVCPTIYLEGYFERYTAGESLGNISEEIIDLFNESSNVSPEGLEFFTDYEQVKKRLFIKLINVKMNEKLLENVPHRIFHDLAIVALVKVEMKGCGIGTVLVHNNHICMWGVREDVLIDDALEQTRASVAVKITPMKDLINEIRQRMMNSGEECEDMDLYEDEDMACGMYVITNDTQMYGAAMMAFPDVLKDAAEIVGGDYYILPSSVHEVIIIARDIVPNPTGINSMIEDVNSTMVKPDEILSDHAYLYLSDRTSLVCESDF